MLLSERPEREAKVVLIGSATVGKTSLVTRFCENSFNPDTVSTVGCGTFTKLLPDMTPPVRLNVWDTGGTERYRSMAPIFVQGAHAVLLVYDIANNASFG
jgi:small GTP-binding protein